MHEINMYPESYETLTTAKKRSILNPQTHNLNLKFNNKYKLNMSSAKKSEITVKESKDRIISNYKIMSGKCYPELNPGSNGKINLLPNSEWPFDHCLLTAEINTTF